MKEVTAGLQPGIKPARNPMTPERIVAAQVSLMSCQVGSHSMRLASRMHLVSFSALTRISLMAKSPMMMGTKSMPAMSSMEPKVSRATPVRGSRPITAVSSPTRADSSPLPRSRPERLTTRLTPRKVRAKYSGGPNARAVRASTGAKKVSPITPMVPAAKEAMAEIPRAGPPRPWRLSW